MRYCARNNAVRYMRYLQSKFVSEMEPKEVLAESIHYILTAGHAQLNARDGNRKRTN